MERGWPVMGTLFRVSARGPDSATVRRGIEAAHAIVARVDSLMSTYRADSEVSRINGRAGTGRWTEVSEPTLRVLQASLQWARRSEGAFDPTVGPLMEGWGFRGGEPGSPSAPALDSLRGLVDYRTVEVDPEGRRARLRIPGAALDFGGVAKGYALDRAVGALREAGVESGMADLGGNVAVFGPPTRGSGFWLLGIRHPRRNRELVGTVETGGGAVSTSGDYEQMFEVDGVRYSHIMDPRTGRPARGTVSVTVAARDGVTADVLSTLLFVLGPEEGRAFLERHAPDGGVTALWIRDPGRGAVRRGLVQVVDGREESRIELVLPAAPDGP